MSKCDHDLAEQETACADGLCPLCLKAENARLTELLKGPDPHYDMAREIGELRAENARLIEKATEDIAEIAKLLAENARLRAAVHDGQRV